MMQKPPQIFAMFYNDRIYIYRMKTSYGFFFLLSLLIGTHNHAVHWILGINFFILLCLSCWEGRSWWGWKDRFLQLCWCSLVGCGKSSPTKWVCKESRRFSVQVVIFLEKSGISFFAQCISVGSLTISSEGFKKKILNAIKLLGY